MLKLKDRLNLTLLVNEAESIIIGEVENQLSEIDDDSICTCDDCLLDIVALALNNVKPAYRSSYTGVIYAQQLHSDENKKLYAEEVKKAIAKVRKNPSHD